MYSTPASGTSESTYNCMYSTTILLYLVQFATENEDNFVYVSKSSERKKKRGRNLSYPRKQSVGPHKTAHTVECFSGGLNHIPSKRKTATNIKHLRDSLERLSQASCRSISGEEISRRTMKNRGPRAILFLSAEMTPRKYLLI